MWEQEDIPAQGCFGPEGVHRGREGLGSHRGSDPPEMLLGEPHGGHNSGPSSVCEGHSLWHSSAGMSRSPRAGAPPTHLPRKPLWKAEGSR